MSNYFRGRGNCDCLICRANRQQYTYYNYYQSLLPKIVEYNNTTDELLIDSKGYKEYTSNQEPNSEGNLDMATGLQYVSNPRYQPNQRKRYKHLRMMLQQLWNADGNPIRFDIDGRFKYADNEIASYLRNNYNEQVLDAAHQTAKRMYKVGRPEGARNIDQTKTTSELESAMPNLDFVDETGFTKEQEVEQEAVNNGLDEAKLPIANFVTHAQLKAKDYITTYDMLKITTNYDKAIQKEFKNFDERITNLKFNTPTIISLERKELPPVDLGIQHNCFPDLLRACIAQLRNKTRLCPWIYGPAGTGKSIAVEKVAEALNLKFRTMGQTLTKHDLMGFINTTGYQTTGFREAYEFGHVFCGDEMDAWAQPAVVALNGALAGDKAAFPDRIVQRHPNFIFCAAANTVGSGATMDYVGRNKQDGASLDRFIFIHWPLDEALEDSFIANKDWLRYVRNVREKVKNSGINPKPLITPRASLHGEALLAAGMSLENVIKATLRKGLSDAQWDLIK